LVPTTDTARILEEVVPNLPDELGGGPIRPAARGLRWATLRLDAPPPLGVQLTIQAADKASATALTEVLDRRAKGLARSTDVREAKRGMEKLLGRLELRLAEGRLELALDEKVLLPVLRPFVKLAVADAEREQTSASLRQVLQALHRYEASHGRF